VNVHAASKCQNKVALVITSYKEGIQCLAAILTSMKYVQQPNDENSFDLVSGRTKKSEHKTFTTSNPYILFQNTIGCVLQVRVINVVLCSVWLELSISLTLCSL